MKFLFPLLLVFMVFQSQAQLDPVVSKGIEYINKGKFKKAHRYFTKEYKKHPENDELLYFKAVAGSFADPANSRGYNYKEALELYIDSNPQSPKGYFKRAVLGRESEEAIKDFEQALQLSATLPEPYLFLGIAKHRQTTELYDYQLLFDAIRNYEIFLGLADSSHPLYYIGQVNRLIALYEMGYKLSDKELQFIGATEFMGTGMYIPIYIGLLPVDTVTTFFTHGKSLLEICGVAQPLPLFDTLPPVLLQDFLEAKKFSEVLPQTISDTFEITVVRRFNEPPIVLSLETILNEGHEINEDARNVFRGLALHEKFYIDVRVKTSAGLAMQSYGYRIELQKGCKLDSSSNRP